MFKKQLVLILIILLITPSIAASNELFKLNCNFKKMSLDPTEEIINGRRFLWISPELPAPEGGYPVLFVLHGATQYAETWFKDGKGGIKGSFIWGKRQTNFVEDALSKGFFIIAPDSIRPLKVGPKAWDSPTSDFNQSKDLPFIKDILDWLTNSSLSINSSRLFCIGFSSGAFMTSRIGQYFYKEFKAIAVHSGGNADIFNIEGLHHEFDISSDINISENHPPTLIIHGNKDRIVPVKAAKHYYSDLQDAGVKSILLLNSVGVHIWQSTFNEDILDWFSFGHEVPLPPTQPLDGPGGSNYSHNKVVKSRYGRGENQYWIFEPAEPTPEIAPLIVFNHGWSGLYPRFYNAWIEHIVKRGNIVVFPRYQRGIVIGFRSFSENAINAVKNAIVELQNGDHVNPDLDKFAITGHSLGGGITANMAARALEENLPIPKAIMPVQPAIAFDEKADFSEISNTTLMIVIVGEDDTVVGNGSGKIIFYNSTKISFTQKDFIIQTTDDYGYPIISSDHMAPTCEINNSMLKIDAMDFYSNWKLFDALTDYAFYGFNEEFCFGNTPEQRFMGNWTDGNAVKELIVTDSP